MNKSINVFSIIKKANNEVEFGNKNDAINYMISSLKTLDKAYHMNLLKEFREGSGFYTLKKPTFKQNYHEINNLSENELYQDVKFIKKCSNDDIIGKDPMNDYYIKMLKYAKRNDGKKYIFTEHTNRYGQTKFYHINNKQVYEQSLVFKQLILENVPQPSNNIYYAKNYYKFVINFAGNQKKDLSTKTTTKMITKMLHTYIKALSSVKPMYQDDKAINLAKQGIYKSNSLIADCDFTLTKTMFGFYDIEAYDGDKSYYSNFTNINNLVMLAENMNMDLLCFTQHLSNYEIA